MKKVLFVILALVVATSCFAQLQSGPSNVVGYVKVHIGNGTQAAPFYQKFGLPFKFWDVPGSGVPSYGVVSTNPSDICTDQLNGGGPAARDQIVRQDNANVAGRDASGNWTGTLESSAGMGPARAYWYVNKSNSSPNGRDLVLAGQVDNASDAQQDVPSISMTQGAFTPYSWRDSRRDTMSVLGLFTAGFRGGGPTATDQVVSQNSALIATMSTAGVWGGTLHFVEPGDAYWINNRTHTNGTWTYDYDNYYGGAPGPASIQLKGGDLGGSILKAPVPKAKAGKQSSRE